jgi:hypothetical protein
MQVRTCARNGGRTRTTSRSGRFKLPASAIPPSGRAAEAHADSVAAVGGGPGLVCRLGVRWLERSAATGGIGVRGCVGRAREGAVAWGCVAAGGGTGRAARALGAGRVVLGRFGAVG